MEAASLSDSRNGSPRAYSDGPPYPKQRMDFFYDADSRHATVTEFDQRALRKAVVGSGGFLLDQSILPRQRCSSADVSSVSHALCHKTSRAFSFMRGNFAWKRNSCGAAGSPKL
jgi:hypothetical protein